MAISPIGKAILVILFLLGGAALVVTVGKSMGATVDSSLCAAEGVVTEMTKVAGQETLHWNCPMDEPLKITSSMLKEEPNLDIVPPATIKAYGGKDAIRENRLIYNANRLMAKEMKNCWTKAGFGKTKLFDDYWLALDKDFWMQTLRSFERPDMARMMEKTATCASCRVVYFTPLAKKLLEEELKSQGEDPNKKGYYIVSPTKYLKSHPAVYGGDKSYWEYLSLNIHETKNMQTRDMSYPVVPREDPLHVYFLRIPAVAELKYLSGAVKHPVEVLAAGLFIKGAPIVATASYLGIQTYGENIPYLSSIKKSIEDTGKEMAESTANNGITTLWIKSQSAMRAGISYEGTNDAKCAKYVQTYKDDGNMLTAWK